MQVSAQQKQIEKQQTKLWDYAEDLCLENGNKFNWNAQNQDFLIKYFGYQKIFFASIHIDSISKMICFITVILQNKTLN